MRVSFLWTTTRPSIPSGHTDSAPNSNTTLCNWTVDFLTNHTQRVRVGNYISPTLVIHTGTPQGCVLSPLLYTLFTHDCSASSSSNLTVKFAEDTTVLRLITNDDEMDYRNEVQHLVLWCDNNNLVLNIKKTKEIIVDCCKNKPSNHRPLSIGSEVVERVSSFKFLGVTMTEDLSWGTHIAPAVRKAQKHLFYLRKLKSYHIPRPLLVNFYNCAISSVLMYGFLMWFSSSSKADQQELQCVVKTAGGLGLLSQRLVPSTPHAVYLECRTSCGINTILLITCSNCCSQAEGTGTGLD